MTELEKVIISRHKGTIEWLARHGITGRVIEHATAEDVADKEVYGVLPLHLAAEAKTVVVIDMPGLPADKRGQDLTPEEMDQYGAKLSRYCVIRLP